jgi:hypothetical protein
VAGKMGLHHSVIDLLMHRLESTVSNYEYFNGDGHMTNSIEPIDDSCGRFMGRLALLIEPSVNK